MRYIQILVLLCLPSFLQGQDTTYTEVLKLADAWLDAQRDYDKLPGISIVVMDDQDILWESAYGFANPETSVKATPEMIGSICSISKLFTAVAIMKLYDEGKLRLDDRIEDILPWFDLRQQYASSGPITIRSLLTHSSGLPREAKYAYWTYPEFDFPTQDQVRDSLKQQNTLYPSSTYFQYSNLGLTLLGEVVEEISGIPYEQYVQDNILNPLGLAQTLPRLPEDLYGKQFAVGYSSLHRNGEREKLQLFDAKGITPAAGFSSTSEDLGKFAAWQFRLLDTTTTEILKPSTLRYMQNVHWEDREGGAKRGLGFGINKSSDGTYWAGHGGSCPGYRSTLILDTKKKRAYSIIINANGVNPNSYAQGVHSLLSKAEKKSEHATSKDLSEYTGHYSFQPWWSEMYVGTLNGMLVFMDLPAESPSIEFARHIEGDIFQFLREDGEPANYLEFKRNADGEIIHIEMNSQRMQKTGQ